MRVLRFEMTRAFRNKWLAVSVALGTLIGLADIWLNVSQYGFNRGRALIQTWIGTDYQFAYNSLFYVLLPLIACFPYAGSCYQDQKTGYESSICIKTSRLSYMIAKEAAVAASGAAAVGCPLLIAMFIAAGIYPDKRPEKLTFLYAGIIDCHMFPRIFAEHPVCYALLFTLLDAVFGGITGLVAMCFARWCGSRFSTIMAPFALYVFTGVMFEGRVSHADGQSTAECGYIQVPDGDDVCCGECSGTRSYIHMAQKKGYSMKEGNTDKKGMYVVDRYEVMRE